MNQLKIFIVEDNPFFGELLKYHLSLNPDYHVFLYQTGKECIENLHYKPDIICLDFGLPDITGIKLLKKIQEINNNIPIIIISGQEDIEVAINFLKAGAKDYIIKNDHTKEILWNSILKIKENIQLINEIEDLKEQLEQKFSFEKTIIGQSEAMKLVFNKINKALHSNINVSITGETGTGKDVVAKAIHYNSDRKNKPFVAVNMAAIPKELIESEFFGHEKGAFTGADNRVIGKFEQADGGTIFLDEIAELDLNLQSKLLRVLQEREVVRVGGKEPIKFNARLIVATHRNLAEEVKKGNFREDLYYRIIGLPIELPPLRDRGNDTLLLAKHFMETFTKENKMKAMILSKAAKDKIAKYPFPGNIRELKSVIDLACVMSDGKEIQPDDLTFNSINDVNVFLSEEKTLREYTSDIILHYLKKNNNDVIKTAQKLDIGKSTIYNLIQSLELKKTPYESSYLFLYNQDGFIKESKDDGFRFEEAQILLGFGAKQLLNEDLFALLKNRFPSAQIALCSTAGEIYHKEVMDDVVSITAISFHSSQLQTGEVSILDFENSLEAGKALLEKLPKDGLKLAFILSDGSKVNGSELVRGMNMATSNGTLITGGLAGDGTKFEETLVGLNAIPKAGKIVAIGFYGDKLQFSHGSLGGWESFGLEREVTKANANILYEIDQKNALDLYKKYLGKYADELPGSALLFPLSMSVSNNEQSIVRTILSINETDQSMTFAGDIPVGSKVRFMKANFDRLIDAASDAAIDCTAMNNSHPQLALLVSCVGRKIILANRIDEEVEAVADIFGTSTTISGFYSYGEISPLKSTSTCELHNQTMTITGIQEID